jgi:RNA polymerase sigma-70 factor (ECF subfamily)
MDEQAFALLIEPHRRALHLHCYRMLGSLHDADDALQETMLRAWKGSDRYEPRAQLGTWLHTIATNVCLTAISRRRPRPAELSKDLEHLQPYPDRLLDDLVARETVELAFITAIQLLPSKQRAVLILRDVLGWSAKEAAEALDDSVAAVTSALQRARVSLEGTRRHVPAPGARERALVKRFMTAWDAVDVDGLVALLTEDALMTMPGADASRGRAGDRRLLRLGAAGRAARRDPPRANLGQPATGARRLLAGRRRQASAVRSDGVANRARPDRGDRRLPGSLAVRTMRPAAGADVGALDIDPLSTSEVSRVRCSSSWRAIERLAGGQMTPLSHRGRHEFEPTAEGGTGHCATISPRKRRRVCHFPPGTSKWIKIEHRMFSFVSLNWRGKPLENLEIIVNLIASTKTNTGLKIYARLDDAATSEASKSQMTNSPP